jgi:hypothetical protein
VVEEVISWFLDIVGRKDGHEADATDNEKGSAGEEKGNGSSEK